MPSASTKTGVAPALTITITSATQISFNPSTAEVSPGGVVGFASANASAWEIELWNRENDDPHPLRLYVPPQGESAMVADPMSVPRDVKFNVMAYPSGKSSGPILTGGTYTIKITSGAGAKK
jgi:plastocyanin